MPVSLSILGCGLRSAMRSRVSAHWASWADSLRPAVANTIIAHLSEPNDLRHFFGASKLRRVPRCGRCSTRLEVTRQGSATGAGHSRRGLAARCVFDCGRTLPRFFSRWLCRSLPCRGSTLTCSVFSSCGACAFLSLCPLALAGVAVHSTALAITWFCAGICSCAGVSRSRSTSQRTSFLRDLDVMAVAALVLTR